MTRPTLLRRPVRTLLTLALLAAALSAAPTQPAEAWPDTQYSDSTAVTTRTIRTGENDPSVKVFELSFSSTAGQRRLITGRVNAFQPTSTPDELLRASVSIWCDNKDAGHSFGSGATENTLRGGTTPFTVQFVHVAAATTTTTCRLTASGGRPRPVGTDSEPNKWFVDSGSKLVVSELASSWSETEQSTAVSRRLAPGQYWTPELGIQQAVQGATVEILVQEKLTTCSSVGGSRDSTTGGVELCEGHVNKVGTTARVDVYARQRNADNTAYCMAPVKVASQQRYISKDVHHAMYHVGGTFTMSTSSACGPWVRYYGTVRIESGADAVVHATDAQVTITNP